MSHPTLRVTLYSSDNKFLTYPCEGFLELFEVGTGGYVIIAVWRGLRSDGSNACPVEVRNPVFEYKGV